VLQLYLMFAIMKGNMRYTFAQFRAEYPDDAACLMAVLENRYGNTCPRCGVIGVKWHPITGRKGFVCSECDRHVYPLTDTIFRKSETSLWNWFYAIFQFSVAKNGVSAKELERTLGVTYKTAWRMCKQIRLLMEQDGGLLGGNGTPVEADETYIGGREYYTKDQYRFSKKVPVLGVVERGGQAKAVVSDFATTSRAKSFLQANLEAGAELHTDESRIYLWSKREYVHKAINHGKGQYANGLVTTNTIEGFWSQLKRSMDGTYHVVSPKYLQNYVNEFVFRYNHRAVAICPVLLARAGKRV
jgi:transposase